MVCIDAFLLVFAVPTILAEDGISQSKTLTPLFLGQVDLRSRVTKDSVLLQALPRNCLALGGVVNSDLEFRVG